MTAALQLTPTSGENATCPLTTTNQAPNKHKTQQKEAPPNVTHKLSVERCFLLTGSASRPAEAGLLTPASGGVEEEAGGGGVAAAFLYRL